MPTPLLIAQGAISLAGMGMSFAQAARQRRVQRQADERIAKFVQSARDRSEVNFMEGLQIPLEGYETAANINMAQSRQAVEALRESGQRAIAGGLGRVQEMTTRASEDLRREMQRDIYGRDLMIRQEDQRLNEIQRDLDLQEVSGEQRRLADSEKFEAAAIGQGFSQLQTGMSNIMQNQALFKLGDDGNITDQVAKAFNIPQANALKFLEGLSEDQNKYIQGMVKQGLDLSGIPELNKRISEFSGSINQGM